MTFGTYTAPEDLHTTARTRFAVIRHAKFVCIRSGVIRTTSARTVAIVRIPGGTTPAAAYHEYERANYGKSLNAQGSGAVDGVVDLSVLAIVPTRREAQAVAYVTNLLEHPTDLKFITKKLGVSVREFARLDDALVEHIRVLASTSTKAAAWVVNYDADLRKAARTA